MFDIDRYLNHLVPSNRVNRLPYPIARFLGYRAPNDESLTTTLTPVIRGKFGYSLTNFWIFFNTFTALILSMCMCKYGAQFVGNHVPILIPSWAASSILVFNSLRAPLAQPRNTIIGTFLSSLIGIIIMKWFSLSQTGQNYYWVGAALSTSISSVVMFVTKTVHPPAGAAALLPCIDENVRKLSWYYLPVQLAISAVFMSVALLFNNIQLAYPMYYWTPVSLSKNTQNTSKIKDSSRSGGLSSRAESDSFSPVRSNTSGRLSIVRTTDDSHIGTVPMRIILTPESIQLPPLLMIDAEQRRVLEDLQDAMSSVNETSPQDLSTS